MYFCICWEQAEMQNSRERNIMVDRDPNATLLEYH